jgi:large subunit ribosomal protein L23
MAKSSRAYDLLIKPLVTEKSAAGLAYNHYTFLVLPEANKIELKQVFEELYPGRKVKAVQTVKIYSKARRAGKKMTRTAEGKKAIFTVEGDPIEIIPGLEASMPPESAE